jgi:LAO/AO transport system kinase
MTLKDIDWYVEGVLEGNRKVLAKTITLIESSLPLHQELGMKVVERLLPGTGEAIRLGITGIPGAGKSTFIESLGMMLLERGHRVAVLAVDPSSTRSGGSILADKTRMERLSANHSAFIRPSPSGGTLGGVARKTRESMLVCEAAGFDVVLVETVGVGQSETAVHSMVDFFLVLIVAGAGDELQGLKKGVIELADAIAVNKADGSNRENAEKAKKDYQSALHLLYPSTPTWSPPVITCSALEVNGLDQIWSSVISHRDKMSGTGELALRRQRQSLEWMWSIVNEGIRQWFFSNPDVMQLLPELERLVEKGLREPTAAAAELLGFLEKERK